MKRWRMVAYRDQAYQPRAGQLWLPGWLAQCPSCGGRCLYAAETVGGREAQCPLCGTVAWMGRCQAPVEVKG